MKLDHKADAEEQAKEFAAVDLADHVIEVEGEGRYLFHRRGTGMYHMRIIFAPGAVLFYGDCEDGILRCSDRDSLAWLRGAASSPDYLLGKWASRPKAFYPGDVEDLILEMIEGEGSKADELEDILSRLRSGALSDYVKLAYDWYEAGLDDCPQPGNSFHAYYMAAYLKAFVKALDRIEATREGDAGVG